MRFRFHLPALLAGFLLSMQAAPLAAQTLSFRDILQRPAIKADARIAYGNDPLQFADLWLPAKVNSKEPHPVVVL